MEVLAITGFVLWIGSVVYYRARIRAYERVIVAGRVLATMQQELINGIISGFQKPKQSGNVVPFRRK